MGSKAGRCSKTSTPEGIFIMKHHDITYLYLHLPRTKEEMRNVVSKLIAANE